MFVSNPAGSNAYKANLTSLILKIWRLLYGTNMLLKRFILPVVRFCGFRRLSVRPSKGRYFGARPLSWASSSTWALFSVNDHIPFPPSLQNIFKEIESDLGIPVPRSGNLTRWAQQGVLLLNATLTVEAHRAASHQGRGWETFTDAVIHKLAEEREHLVFILWGSYAQRKGDFIDRSRHLVLQSPHPSPLSAHRGFFGNHHSVKLTNI